VCEEWDLSVLDDSRLKLSHQCVKAVSEANRALGMIKRKFTKKDDHNISALYKISGQTKIRILHKSMESISAKKICTALCNQANYCFWKQNNKECVLLLQIPSLETRRKRGDLDSSF